MACRKLEARGHLLHKTGTPPKHFSRECMLHKKNSKQEMGNYRPISMSNHISKIWEREVGINGKVGRCLENWLSLRNQFVQCGKERSKDRIVYRSCIQGSVLGPTMWIIYIQSLLDRLENKCNYYAYADDVTLVAKISSKIEIIEFDKVLRSLITWGQEFGMRWGAHKTQRMAITYPRCGGGRPPKNDFRWKRHRSIRNNGITRRDPKQRRSGLWPPNQDQK